MTGDLLVFGLVGFLAQIVDGALGMAYGVISTTVLLGFGVPPGVASACVHSAEVFTTATSATSHAIHRNVEWKLFLVLAIFGSIGGAAGAYLLTSIPGDHIRPFITAYLAIMGIVILHRAFRPAVPRPTPLILTAPLGTLGGFLDAVGGGGWGPTVTSTLVGIGGTPRKVIGTVNTAEFLVTVTTSTTFIAVILSGHWSEADNIREHAYAVGGLILGGIVAAPLAGHIVKIANPKTLTIIVGLLVIGLASFQTLQLLGT